MQLSEYLPDLPPSGPDQINEALVALALALGAETVEGWSRPEADLVAALPYPRIRVARTLVRKLRDQIGEGLDPLGEMFRHAHSREARRPLGATYTPPGIVERMLSWADGEDRPARVIDPGLGSGRFAVAAGRRFRRAQIVGVEIDPIAAIIGRANLAAAGLARRSTVVLSDFRAFEPEQIDGRTLYVGNPPYVRHHQIEPRWKEWLGETARERGLGGSQLAGLHVHFFLATACVAQREDYGAFITSAEWLDVNYGALVRELLLDGLGGLAIHVLEPTAMAFEDAATTAAITCFRVGARPRVLRLRRVKSVAQLGRLDQGRPVRRERLAEARRWTPLTRPGRKLPEGWVELGELCRVHRGAVTGANRVWVVEPSYSALPESTLFASVTRARELFAARTVLEEVDHLRRVVDLPADLDVFERDERRAVTRFLNAAKRRGAASGYIARNRRAWWSVGLREPAPILATYMARRPPIFIRNLGEARHINIAHGLYPRQPIGARALDRLAGYLRDFATIDLGRTYAGGLTKFEPKEMERLPVPDLPLLVAA